MVLTGNIINKCKNDSESSEFAGIGGWLCLPAVSVVVMPLLLAMLVFMNIRTMKDPLINGIFGSYPGLMEAYISQTLVLTAQILLAVYVAYLFFRKKRALPKMIIALITVHMLAMAGNLSWISIVFRETALSENIGALSTALMTVAGIPYFLRSRRVRETFVNQ